MIMPGDPLSRPLTEIARDLREGRTRAQDLIEAAIARHERFGERLHASMPIRIGRRNRLAPLPRRPTPPLSPG
jgi:hypothetical protein